MKPHPRTQQKGSKKGSKIIRHDIIIVGGGPVGLSFAAALKASGLSVALIEKLPKSSLANPCFDGRDTALTHSSIQILKDLGVLDRIPKSEISPIREARVLNGTSPYALNFDSKDEGKEALGYLVSNHVIRQAAYKAIEEDRNITFYQGAEVVDLRSSDAALTAMLSDGTKIESPLVVAADSRFSRCRTLMGIPVATHDFGRSAVVGRVRHTKPHNNIAYECFHYGRTLAVLPLQGQTASIVITLPSDEVGDLLALSPEAFSRDLTERFGDYHGKLIPISGTHSYPLVASYAKRFAGPRFALLGDAAVGMHPVTAHGFNFGLYGVHSLASSIVLNLSLGVDIGSPVLLRRYQAEHRAATFALYKGTNALVRLFTHESPGAKFARNTMLRLGNVVMPAKSLITRQLTQSRLHA